MAVLHLSRSGSFPFCVLPASGLWDPTSSTLPAGYVGPGTYYPVGLSLADAMRWYWQAKTWQAAAAFAFSGTQPNPSNPSFSAPITDTVTVDRGGTQRELVCPAGVSGGDATVSLVVWGTGASPYAYSWGGLIYPRLAFSAQNAILTVSSYRFLVAIPKRWPVDGTADGFTLPLWYDEAGGYDSVGGASGDSGPWTQSRSGTAVLSITATY
ncbi:MAG: hypothetical protein PW734_03770 [Verrucomicrobium sp.]|nr:hypothetical protein [Verrucomicrobium sp.]